MILALDVHYGAQNARAVGGLFNWNDDVPGELVIVNINEVEDYIPGEFYKRELPCLIKIIEHIGLEYIEAIVIDGYVYIDNELSPGLGGRLYEILERRVPVIGVAKTSFLKNKDTVKEITRGESKNPLYISSIGIDLNLAALLVSQMKGNYRMPDILKMVDTKTKEVDKG